MFIPRYFPLKIKTPAFRDLYTSDDFRRETNFIKFVIRLVLIAKSFIELELDFFWFMIAKADIIF